MSANRTIFLSAGEESGDRHGARLARELRERIPGVRLVGLGGSRMRAEGVELLENLDRLAIIGVAEILGRAPELLRLRQRLRRFLIEERVDLLVPIDYPGFNLGLARFAHAKGIPVLYFIAPQVWAWRAGRARQLRRWSDLVCVVLPFEETFLDRYGVRVRFVGHPLLDDEEGTRAEPGAKGESSVLGLFPGSREQEIRRMLPIFLEAARRMRGSIPDLRVRIARAVDLPVSLYDSCDPAELDRPESVVRVATAAITKSGTITLQLAIGAVPMVVAYRMNRLTYRVLRHLVRVPDIALANLVAGERIVPELIQDEVTAEGLATAVAPFLDLGSPERERTRERLRGVRERLGEPGCGRRVADACLELLSGA